MTLWTKIKGFVKKYWIWILIIPGSLILLSSLGKGLFKMFKNKEPGDVTKAGNDTDNKINTIKKDENDKLNKIDSDLDKDLKNIDKGDPTPANVFNKTIGKMRKQ